MTTLSMTPPSMPVVLAQSSDDFAALGVVFALFGLVMLAVAILMVVAAWKVFAKAGYEGWEALLPYHNLLVGLEIAGRPRVWSLFPIVGAFVLILPFIGPLVWLVGGVALAVVVGMDFARSFGKDTGFGVGLALLPFVFLPILAFGDARYLGPAGPEGYQRGGTGAPPVPEWGPPGPGAWGTPAPPAPSVGWGQDPGWGQDAGYGQTPGWGQPPSQDPGWGQQPGQDVGWGQQPGQDAGWGQPPGQDAGWGQQPGQDGPPSPEDWNR
ncbi:DUF5684 domain-containing protein [Euzebya rosea]|uniref:DUF5684 domain-containing protein n=1 Tax=Euzebya rosea TaxID=2052804 RepID=UPI00196A53F3|nr:DUF5684 domain-containing protein [Euzebya rosea]